MERKPHYIGKCNKKKGKGLSAGVFHKYMGMPENQHSLAKCCYIPAYLAFSTTTVHLKAIATERNLSLLVVADMDLTGGETPVSD
jgi:hypothetical protein